MVLSHHSDIVGSGFLDLPVTKVIVDFFGPSVAMVLRDMPVELRSNGVGANEDSFLVVSLERPAEDVAHRLFYGLYHERLVLRNAPAVSIDWYSTMALEYTRLLCTAAKRAMFSPDGGLKQLVSGWDFSLSSLGNLVRVLHTGTVVCSNDEVLRWKEILSYEDLKRLVILKCLAGILQAARLPSFQNDSRLGVHVVTFPVIVVRILQIILAANGVVNCRVNTLDKDIEIARRKGVLAIDDCLNLVNEFYQRSPGEPFQLSKSFKRLQMAMIEEMIRCGFKDVARSFSDVFEIDGGCVPAEAPFDKRFAAGPQTNLSWYSLHD